MQDEQKDYLPFEKKELIGKCMLTLTADSYAFGNDVNALKRSGDVLIKKAVDWMVENKKAYRCFGGDAAAKLSRFKKIQRWIEAGVADAHEEAIKQLAAFHNCFLTNPYLYKKRVLPTKASYITANRMDCYFIAIEITTDKAWFVPIGCLESVISAERVRLIVSHFVRNSMNEMKSFSGITKSLCYSYASNYTGGNISAKKESVGLLWVSAVLLVVGLLYSTRQLVVTDWRDFFSLLKQPINILYPIHYAATVHYGIHAISSLNIILFILPFWCLLVCLKRIKPLKMLFGKCITERRYTLISMLSQWIDKSIEELSTEDYSRNKISQEKGKNIAKMMKAMRIVSDFKDKKSTGRNNKASDSKGEGQSLSNDKPTDRKRKKRKKNKKPGLVFLVLTVVLCLALSYAAKRPGLQEKYDRAAAWVSDLAHTAVFSVQKPGLTTTGLSVWAKPSQDNLLLYQLPANTSYTLADEKKPVEGYTKIRFQTPGGYRTGWIDTAMMEAYNPYLVTDLFYVKPSSHDATNLSWLDQWLHSPENVSDHKLRSTWLCGEEGGGIGEKITLEFNEKDMEEKKEHLIQVIGIATGDGSSEEAFKKSGRPTEFTIEFITGDTVTKTLRMVLEDTLQMQYIRCNEPIPAESVRFVVTQITKGDHYADTYVSEIHLFEANPAIVVVSE